MIEFLHCLAQYRRKSADQGLVVKPLDDARSGRIDHLLPQRNIGQEADQRPGHLFRLTRRDQKARFAIHHQFRDR